MQHCNPIYYRCENVCLRIILWSYAYLGLPQFDGEQAMDDDGDLVQGRQVIDHELVCAILTDFQINADRITR